MTSGSVFLRLHRPCVLFLFLNSPVCSFSSFFLPSRAPPHNISSSVLGKPTEITSFPSPAQDFFLPPLIRSAGFQSLLAAGYPSSPPFFSWLDVEEILFFPPFGNGNFVVRHLTPPLRFSAFCQPIMSSLPIVTSLLYSFFV